MLFIQSKKIVVSFQMFTENINVKYQFKSEEKFGHLSKKNYWRKQIYVKFVI